MKLKIIIIFLSVIITFYLIELGLIIKKNNYFTENQKKTQFEDSKYEVYKKFINKNIIRKKQILFSIIFILHLS